MAKPVRFRNKWRIRPMLATGQRGSEVYDRYQDAEFALRRHELAAAEVKRGFRRMELPNKSFGDLCDYWLINRAPHKRSGKDDVSIISARLRPAFGQRRLRDLGAADVDEYNRRHAGLSPKTRANHLTLLISMLNAAVDLEWLSRAPRIRKPKVRAHSDDFRFLKTSEEVSRLLNVARDREGLAVHMMYRVAVYTGMRAGELAGLRWDAVDFDKRLITVSRSFDGPTKANDLRRVPIVDALLAALRKWRLQSSDEFVFTNTIGNMLKPSDRVFREVLHRVLKAAGFPADSQNARSPTYITFHGLRHTFASHYVMNGGDLFKLQKILGHKTVQMTMRYAHLVPDAFATDYKRFPTNSACDPDDADNVVSL